MKSDIILEDYKIKAVSNHADFDVNHLVINGNKTEINSDKMEVNGFEISLPKQVVEIRLGSIRLGNRTAQQSRHHISVTSEAGSSSISSTYVRTERVLANEINTKDLLIGLSPEDNPKPGNIKVLNKQGEVAITIDGINEDILLKSIGSLTEKIKTLEKRISILETYHPRVIKGPIGG